MRTAACVAILLAAGALAQAPAPAAPEVIRIDPHAAGKPFPHFWEQMFGSGRANLAMRDSYRRDLDNVKQITSLEYVRFHAIFDDENGVYSEGSDGKPIYNWSYVDQIYDGLRNRGVRPFVELSFMPRKLAAKQAVHPFWYHPDVSPPADWGKWGALVEAFARHLVERYGIGEVSKWYFEVWNEPNIDFWAGDPKFETYTHLYAEAARAIKRVHPQLQTGGPATAQAAWVGRFIDWCVKNKAPLDFVSTHAYANDTAQDVLGTDEKIPRRDMLTRAVEKVHREVKASQRPSLPIIWSEFNASYKNEVAVTDSPFIGPWLANLIRTCDGLTTMMSYWTFSDVFEEQGVVQTPFYGGFGLIASGGIPKASFNDFRLLHQLGNQRLESKSDSAIVTRRPDGSLAIVLWNYSAPEVEGPPRSFRLQVIGAAPKFRVTIVDRQRGNALAAWIAMGRPPFPSPEQLQKLKKAAALPPAVPFTGDVLTLPAHALALIETQ